MLIVLITNIVFFSRGFALHVSQPYRVEGKEERVTLNCAFSSEIRPKEMQVTLYKGLHGHEMICSAYVNLSESLFTTNGTVSCRGNVSSGKVDMDILGLRGEDTDIYRCELEILFPPPYLRTVGNGTIVYIRETPNCPSALIQRQTSEWSLTDDGGPVSLLYAILIITSCIFILQIIKIIWKRRDSASMAPIISHPDLYRKF